MDKVIRKFSSFEAAQKADDEHYARLSVDEKLRELLHLLEMQNADAPPMERVVKKYPLHSRKPL